MQIDKRTKKSPSQAQAVRDDRGYIPRRDDTLLHQVEGLMPQRRLKAVRRVSFHVAPDVNGLLASGSMEPQGRSQRLIRCRAPGDAAGEIFASSSRFRSNRSGPLS
jgi:hypothetical protein